jgi:hypothetical protein
VLNQIGRSDKHPMTNPNGHAILKWRLFIEASFGLNVFSVCNFGQFGFSKGNYLNLSNEKLEKY